MKTLIIIYTDKTSES